MESENKDKNNTEIKLDRKSKILFAVIAVLIAGAVVATFWRIVLKRDYIVQAQIDCDPTTENCFVWQCDPNSTVEGEACTGDPETDAWYYEILHRNAKNIPNCDPNDEDCTAYVCEEGEADCSYELCSADNVPEGESCNDPVQYNINNPPKEDSEECAPDDQECLDAAEQEECAPDDQECLDAESQDETCTPDDEECLSAQEDENSTPAPQPETNSDSTSTVPPLPM